MLMIFDPRHQVTVQVLGTPSTIEIACCLLFNQFN
ncbi:hypothetical protein Pint_28095 [Pistacia integerrima]|uniref:Uncharacterized protein n=1 Tax=Pistacia integerrima TaxID=434235 RepID=A0ACC0YPD2_9ROSI|nr:hypothetical protein Pint_28095 [Pistacia integerrima]